MQNELTQAGPLLDAKGNLMQVGWSRKPLLDCNLENVNFYRIRALQRFRVKRWDYYAVFTPNRFFSATVADLGYAGNIFVYTLDFRTGELHEEGLVIPLGSGIKLERNPEAGEASFANDKVSLEPPLPETEGLPSGSVIYKSASPELPRRVTWSTGTPGGTTRLA